MPQDLQALHFPIEGPWPPSVASWCSVASASFDRSGRGQFPPHPERNTRFDLAATPDGDSGGSILFFGAQHNREQCPRYPE